MPWILLFDPTSACSLHCKGCWAAEYGNRLDTGEDMDRIVTEGELGIHWYMYWLGKSPPAARRICSSWLRSTRLGLPPVLWHPD